MENDLHNIVPAVGELNADRSDLPFGIVSGEKRRYGACDFEISWDADVVEPRPEIRGDIARIYFYMRSTYGIPISERQRKLFEMWTKEDPVDTWEQTRSKKIHELQP
jgi:deoxyribonuclease-1